MFNNISSQCNNTLLYHLLCAIILGLSSTKAFLICPQSHEFKAPAMPTTTSLLSSIENANPSLLMTEADVLARNQGELTMPSQSELENAMVKQREIASISSSCCGESKSEGEVKKHTFYDYNIDKDGFGAIVMENGVVRIDNVLSQSTANEMVQYVDQLLVDTTTAVKEGLFPEEALFGNVFGKENRWDLLMPIEASQQVMNCLKELLHEGSPIATSIGSILGNNAELYELSTMISDPGSSAQPLHPDIKYQDTIHPLLTCFVALQDIEKEMGPTLFMTNSATQEYHDDLHNRHLDKEAKGLVATSHNELGTLGIGDCSLYSAMTLHCGSANKSEKRRRLFYFSFINKSLFLEEGGRNYVSIRPEVKERELTLSGLQQMMEDWV